MTQDSSKVQLKAGDALLVIDIQNDFLPGGSLAVSDGDQVVPPLNGYILSFTNMGLPIFASRDWHPANHCSFKEQGGPWPPHCVQNTKGAEFSSQLALPPDVAVISKATTPEKENYSDMKETELPQILKNQNIKRLFIGGLATDYCVLATVTDALKAGFDVFLLTDAIRPVDVQPGDGDRAIEEMEKNGARLIQLSELNT